MDPVRLIEAFSRPEAFDPPPDRVEVIQTHISVVFLAGDLVYKVKKPVDLGFLDFTTLERRRHFCEEEVRLNRRLAPDVYLGVVPIVEVAGAPDGGSGDADAPDGGPRDADIPSPGAELRFADPDTTPEADAVEWAVLMRRLPEELTLESWLAEGTLRPYHLAVLGRRIAAFHARAERGPDVSRWGRLEVVAGNARENLEQSRDHPTLTPELHARLAAALEREIERAAPRIEARAERNVPCDTHGDLHLDHVYLFPDRDPPDDIVVIDCVEFNERFRYADPVSDIAFLDMDLRYHARSDLANVATHAYFEASGDEEGRTLLGFYSAYRAAVRAKVAGMRAAGAEVPPADREAALASGRAHWLLALRLLEPPRARPALVLIGGLPGTGKSTLAASLGERAGFVALSSDVTRKRLAGLEPTAPASAAFGAGIYTREWNDRTYEALLDEAESRLLRGERVIVDASFREDARRSSFLELARRLRTSAVFLRLEAPPSRVRDRILTRDPGASDADVDIYEAALARWEPPSDASRARTVAVDTGQSHAWSVEQSLTALASLGMW